MKKITILGVTAGMLAIMAMAPATSIAQTPYTLTLINHYDKPLTFSGRQNAAEVLPDLPADFKLDSALAPNSETHSITTRVIDLQKHAYMKAVDGNKHSAFFGVEVADNRVKVHGYIGKGIAYSWTTDVITFCTPDDYAKAGKCL